MLANSSDNQKFMIYPRSLVGTVAGGLGFVWLVRITQIELPLIFQHFLLLNFLISWSFFQFPPHDIAIRSREHYIYHLSACIDGDDVLCPPVWPKAPE